LPVELKAGYQIADVSSPGKESEGFQRLAIGLKRAGLDPNSFEWPPARDPHRSVYPGLQSLDEEDAAIFFGRDAGITKAIDTLRRMRDGAEDIAREEMARIDDELPAEIRSYMERVLLKTVHRLVHKPTLELRAAAEADNRDLVSVLAGLFDATPPASGRATGGISLLADELNTTGRPRRHTPLDLK